MLFDACCHKDGTVCSLYFRWKNVAACARGAKLGKARVLFVGTALHVSFFYDLVSRTAIRVARQVGGWKGTMDTHDLIEQTHKCYRAAKKQAVKQEM